MRELVSQFSFRSRSDCHEFTYSLIGLKVEVAANVAIWKFCRIINIGNNLRDNLLLSDQPYVNDTNICLFLGGCFQKSVLAPSTTPEITWFFVFSQQIGLPKLVLTPPF